MYVCHAHTGAAKQLVTVATLLCIPGRVSLPQDDPAGGQGHQCGREAGELEPRTGLSLNEIFWDHQQ